MRQVLSPARVWWRRQEGLPAFAVLSSLRWKCLCEQGVWSKWTKSPNTLPISSFPSAVIEHRDQRQRKEGFIWVYGSRRRAHNWREAWQYGAGAGSWEAMSSTIYRKQTKQFERGPRFQTLKPPSDEWYTFPASLHVLQVSLPPKLCY